MIVVIESPYSHSNGHTVEDNVRYSRACLRDSLLRGESPFASHLLYTQDGVLDDLVSSERKMGMEAGWDFYWVAHKCVVYTDMGISQGMNAGIRRARECNLSVQFRVVEGWRL